MPKVSIIVPVYKVEQYIRECLDSIKAQTFTDWECLLIDDGSPDDSGKICDEYAQSDARFKVFHVENGGVSRARNIGLDNMMGEWVMFVDSDDAIDANTLELCLSIIRKRDLDIVQFSFASEKMEWGKHNGTKTDYLDNVSYIKEQKFLVCVGGSLIRASIIKDYGIRFNESLKLAEDQLVMMECINRSSRLEKIPNQLYYYRPNPNGATRNQKTKDILNSINKLVEFKRNNPVWSALLDRINSLFIIDLIHNKDLSISELSRITRKAKLYNESMLFGSCKLLCRLSKINSYIAVISLIILFNIKKKIGC